MSLGDDRSIFVSTTKASYGKPELMNSGDKESSTKMADKLRLSSVHFGSESEGNSPNFIGQTAYGVIDLSKKGPQ
jgi:hypothetical protein